MYSTGNAGFLTAACNPNRTIDTKVVLNTATAVNLGINDIVSYKATYASTGGKAFTPGSFVASILDLSLIAASSTVSGVDFKTAVINNLMLSAGIKVSSTMVYVPMGKFYPEEDGIEVGDNGFVSIKATDIPPILYTQFDSSILTLPCTVNQALSKIASATGLTITVATADFPNLSVTLIESFSLTTTYREALMYIAEAIGAFVHMGRNGEIQLKKVFSGLVDLGAVLDENYLFSVKKQESSVKPFQYIGIKADKDDIGVTQEVGGVTTECKYDIIDNPLTYGHPEDFLAGLVSPTSFTEFYPAVISFHGRPDIDVGDVLRYVYKGVSYLIPVCNHVFEYNGGFKTTVESIGTDALNTSSADSGLKTQITALKQNINTLIRDLNQTQSQITEINGSVSNISTLLQTADSLLSRVSAIEGEIEKSTSWEQTAESLRLSIESVDKSLKGTQEEVASNQNKFLSYFDYLADGLVIGVSNSTIKLKLSHNKVVFLKDDTNEVAYLSDGKLYVTDAHFLKSLVLGNFEFVPRNNGNLSLRRRG